MTKKELLRIVWDAYPNQEIPAVFESVFAKDGELLSSLHFLGDGLLVFLLREVWETVEESENPYDMVQSALESIDRAMDDMLRVQNALGTWKPS